MTADTGERDAWHLVLLCFDGSDDAATAIAQAAELLAPRRAVVLTVWEPVATWEPYDPATILSAPVSKLLSRGLGFDEIAAELAEEKVRQGVALASSAGFAAQGRVAHGKTWRTICDVAGEIDAAMIVLGRADCHEWGRCCWGAYRPRSWCTPSVPCWWCHIMVAAEGQCGSRARTALSAAIGSALAARGAGRAPGPGTVSRRSCASRG